MNVSWSCRPCSCVTGGEWQMEGAKRWSTSHKGNFFAGKGWVASHATPLLQVNFEPPPSLRFLNEDLTIIEKG